MRTSGFVQIVEDGSGYGLCYHSLLGNLFLLEPDYLTAVKKYQLEEVNVDEVLGSEVLSGLADAYFIVGDTVDERALLASQNDAWMQDVTDGGRLTMLNLIVSEACNFGCPHCLHKCNVANNDNHGKKKLMDYVTAKEAIDAYAELVHKHNPGASLKIHFGSAEPLLNWEVVRRVSVYTRSIDPTSTLTMNTNLSLVNAEIAAFIHEYDIQIATSLDGPPSGNDAIRIYPNGGGTFADILSAFTVMQSAGVPLDGFSITINDLNFDSIDDEFVSWLAAKGFLGIASDIDLINARNANRSVAECVEKVVSLRVGCLENGIENNGSWTTAYDYLVNGNEDGVGTFCRAVRGKNISINPEGIAFVCGHTTSVVGNLDQFDEIFVAEGAYASLVASRMPGVDILCRGCEIEGMCAGQCHITREVARDTGNGRLGYLCEFFRLATRRLLEIKLENELEKLSKEEVIRA